MFRTFWYLSLVLVVAGWPTDAGAQTASPDIADLQRQLRAGDAVTVRLLNGTSVDGRLDAVSASQLSVTAAGTRRDIPTDQIARVDRRRNGILLGAIIGAAAGVPFGVFMSTWFHNEGGNEAAAFLLPVGAGLGAGIAIDAALVRPRTVFERVPPARAHLFPLLGHGRRGVGLTVAF